MNDRTVHFLYQGEVDMSATTAEFGSAPASNTVSDAEVTDVIDIETEVEISAVDKNKTRQGGACFKYLNLTLSNLETYGLFKNIDRYNYKHNCVYLALEAGGVSDIKFQHVILTLRNRTIHKCGLTNVCNVLDVMFWESILNLFV